MDSPRGRIRLLEIHCDRNIYLPCVAWGGMDAAVMVGARAFLACDVRIPEVHPSARESAVERLPARLTPGTASRMLIYKSIDVSSYETASCDCP